MRNKKKWLAALLAAAMVFTGIPSTAGASVESEPTVKTEEISVENEAVSEEIEQEEAVSVSEELLASYPLQTDTKDISGNGRDAEIHGTVSWSDGLVLPGGKKTSDSSASYVTLPGSLFEGQEDLTISVWIKSNTNSGNYAALFFGTKEQNNKMPLNYWLFNPTNPGGLFKSVFTNSNNNDAPYNSEVGVTAGTTSGYKGVWTHYTTVLTENSLTGYINGKKVGTASKSKKIADFGSGLQAYIGRSNYVEDNTYAGSFQDLKIYRGAMTEEQVNGLYYDASQVNENIRKKLLEEIKNELSLSDQLNDGVVAQEAALKLPAEKNGAAITWTSDKDTVISSTGQVTLPAQNTTVTLTATLSMGDVTAQKAFSILVLSKEGMLDYVADGLGVPWVLDAKAKLPAKVGDVTVSWSGSEYVKADGTIAADFKGKKKIELTADITNGVKKKTKTFTSNLMGTDTVYVESYTRIPQGDYVDKLAYSMFLAYSSDASSFTALHDDTGILFARAVSNKNETLTAKSLKDPYLFYTKEGDFGVVAVRTEANGNKDAAAASSVLLYTSKDLMQYEEAGLIDLHTDAVVSDPVCEYDAAADLYRITWNDGSGNYYQNTIKELKAGAEASEPVAAKAPEIRKAATGFSNVEEGNLLPIDSSVGTRLYNKLTKLVNTGIHVPESVEAKTAEDVQKIRATASYSDGSVADKAVNWDLSGVDFKKPGTYRVEGTVTQPTFPENTYMFHARPDPEMVKYNGKFYFISTDENGQGRIYIRQSDTLEGIKDSSEVLLLDGNSYPDLFRTCLWAPELHVINGELYVLFAGSLTDWSGVQSHMMKLKEGGDPMSTDGWEKPIRVQDMDGENLYDANTQGITLDMTYFEVGNTSYVCWAQRQLKPVDTGSWLYIATVDREKPWMLTSDRVAISKPDYGWDNNATFVDEGPFVIQRDGGIYMTFSGAATNNTYCIGMLTASADSDLLDAASWTKKNYPIMTSWSVPGQGGPGHNSYIYDDDGVLYNVYHAKWNNGTRSASIRRVHFDADGDPVLDMVPERDLLEEYRHVSMNVQVVDESHKPTPTPTNPPKPTPTQTPTVDHTRHVGKTFVSGSLKYKVTKDDGKVREVRVTSLKGKTDTVKIPKTVTNKEWKETFRVTAVKAGAFKGKKIKKAVIGANVKTIGPNAFLNCKKLKTVVIGKAVKTIGIRAFYGCTGLKKVTIKSTVLKAVKKNAFKKISKKAVICVPKKQKRDYVNRLKGKTAKGVKIK